MSVIRKKPFIESVLDTLTTSELSSLKYVMNNGGNNVSVSLVSGSFEKGEGKIITSTITPVYLEVESNKVYSAILIWNASYCVAIPYHRFQDVKLIKINPSTRTYEEIKEYCDINELRRIIDDTAESSFDADGEAGQVLTADGEGGVQWKDNPQIIALTTNSGTLTSDQVALASAGNTVITLSGEYYYRFSKSVSAIVFKATPRVDNDTTYIDNITIDLSDNTYSASYETIAAGEGFTPTYDDELSDSSTNAVQNKVITDAITDIQGDVSDIETALETKANVDGNYPTMSVGEADVAKNIKAYSDDSGALQENPYISQGTGTNNNVEIVTTGDYCEIKSKNGNTVVVNQLVNTGDTEVATISGHKYLTIFSGVYAIVISSGSAIAITDDTTDKVIDLTQWFNGNIPQDLLDNPSHFSWYYNGSLAYNTGELVNANGRYLECGQGRQLWDEEWEKGTILGSNGQNANNDSIIRSKNYIGDITPNKPIHFYKSYANYTDNYIMEYDNDKNYIGYTTLNGNGTVTLSPNTRFIRFTLTSTYGGTYKNDITISLYYTPEQGGEGYDKYYPYVAPKVIDTGSEVLRSAGNVCDSKAPNGTIHRLVGSRAYQSGDENDNTLLTDGTTTYYPLATPTTEQGTPFSAYHDINDYSYMLWRDTDNNLVSVPQGASIFYPVNYAGTLDDLVAYVDGDVTNLAKKSDLSTAITAFLTGLTGYDATKKQTLKNNQGTLSWEDDE